MVTNKCIQIYEIFLQYEFFFLYDNEFLWKMKSGKINTLYIIFRIYLEVSFYIFHKLFFLIKFLILSSLQVFDFVFSNRRYTVIKCQKLCVTFSLASITWFIQSGSLLYIKMLVITFFFLHYFIIQVIINTFYTKYIASHYTISHKGARNNL